LLSNAIPFLFDFDLEEDDLLEVEEFLEWFKLLNYFENGLMSKD
jgi:hypothetical protein